MIIYGQNINLDLENGCAQSRHAELQNPYQMRLLTLLSLLLCFAVFTACEQDYTITQDFTEIQPKEELEKRRIGRRPSVKMQCAAMEVCHSFSRNRVELAVQLCEPLHSSIPTLYFYAYKNGALYNLGSTSTSNLQRTRFYLNNPTYAPTGDMVLIAQISSIPLSCNGPNSYCGETAECFARIPVTSTQNCMANPYPGLQPDCPVEG